MSTSLGFHGLPLFRFKTDRLDFTSPFFSVIRESRFGCLRIARVISSEVLGTMSKNNLRRITLVRGPIWGIHSLTLIISCFETISHSESNRYGNIKAFHSSLSLNKVLCTAVNTAKLWCISQFCTLSMEFSLKHKASYYCLKTIVRNH